jgi:hypothetical protein
MGRAWDRYLPQTMEDLMPYSVSFYGDISFPLLLLPQINQAIIPCGYDANI